MNDEIITVAPTDENSWIQTWGIDVLSGYACPGQFIELGTLYIQGIQDPIAPFTFGLTTGGDIFTINWGAITRGSLTPQVASLVSLQA